MKRLTLHVFAESEDYSRQIRHLFDVYRLESGLQLQLVDKYSTERLSSQFASEHMNAKLDAMPSYVHNERILFDAIVTDLKLVGYDVNLKNAARG